MMMMMMIRITGLSICRWPHIHVCVRVRVCACVHVCYVCMYLQRRPRENKKVPYIPEGWPPQARAPTYLPTSLSQLLSPPFAPSKFARNTPGERFAAWLARHGGCFNGAPSFCFHDMRCALVSTVLHKCSRHAIIS